MNDFQEEKQSSNELVVKIANENPEATKLIPAFEDGIKKLAILNSEIEKNRILQEKDNTGVTENKGFTMNSLTSQTLDISGAVYSYAYKKKDVVLMAKVDFKSHALSKLVPGKIISAATTTLEEAKKISVTDMAHEGITAAELTAYEEKVTYFQAISNEPRHAQIDTSVYTKNIIELFKEINKLFKNTLDRLVRQFKTKAPDFYLKYRSARKAIHRGPNNPDTQAETGQRSKI